MVILLSYSTENKLAELKTPPHSIEAEQSVLGGLMLDSSRWVDVADILVANDFYRRDHRLIFASIERLIEDSMPADVITTQEYLDNSGELEKAGGLSYLDELTRNTPSAANISAYAKIVQEHSIMRRLLNSVNDINQSIFTPEGRSPKEILDFAEQQIYAISDEGAKHGSGFVAVNKLLKQTVDRIEELFKSGSELTGLSTGFADLDKLTTGLQDSDLIIVAGRPSMGKTSLAMNIAENVAVGSDKAVAIFSMEMSGVQLVRRMLTSLGRINAQRVRTGALQEDDWSRLTSAINLLDQRRIYIDDTPGLSPSELRARCRRLASQNEDGLGLIIIDYLQLMSLGGTTENRATELSAITRNLKTLAKEINVPVIALSQLNRSLEQRTDKRPIMSDLRESGSIEQDADLIMFIYRDEVYNEESENKGIAEIIISKQRNGPTGTIKLTFFGEYTKFENFINPISAEAAGDYY
ncbi:MAG TPA: replicative DNA helicase [Gammaproteobacteria bacterium]|nr:replicative DNA helicase [Gammaproteobacteria bacterium]HDH16845.1 replicative DNA helicase [Gammaproteobacteria bacterium]HDZ77689.1 replicative DNA helicase [Gammaproteobacteria bacterium]